MSGVTEIEFQDQSGTSSSPHGSLVLVLTRRDSNSGSDVSSVNETSAIEVSISEPATENVSNISNVEHGAGVNVITRDVVMVEDVENQRVREHSGSDIGSDSDVEETLFICQFDAKKVEKRDQLENDNIQNVEKSIRTSDTVNVEIDKVQFDSTVDRPHGGELIFQSESAKIDETFDFESNVSDQFEPDDDNDQNLPEVLQSSSSSNSDVEEMLMIRLFDLNRSQSTEVARNSSLEQSGSTINTQSGNEERFTISRRQVVDVNSSLDQSGSVIETQSGKEERFTVSHQEFKEIDQMTPIQIAEVPMNVKPPKPRSNRISIAAEEKLIISRSVFNSIEKAEAQTFKEIDEMTPIQVVDVPIPIDIKPPEAGSNRVSIPVEEKMTVSRSVFTLTENVENQTIQTRKLAFTVKPDEVAQKAETRKITPETDMSHAKSDSQNEMKISAFRAAEKERRSVPAEVKAVRKKSSSWVIPSSTSRESNETSPKKETIVEKRLLSQESSTRKLQPVQDQPEPLSEPEAAQVHKLVRSVEQAVPAKNNKVSKVEDDGKRLLVKTARAPMQRYVQVDSDGVEHVITKEREESRVFEITPDDGFGLDPEPPFIKIEQSRTRQVSKLPGGAIETITTSSSAFEFLGATGEAQLNQI